MPGKSAEARGAPHAVVFAECDGRGRSASDDFRYWHLADIPSAELDVSF